MRIPVTLRIYIGWDYREPEAFEVCAHSIRRHASIPVSILPLIQDEMRAAGHYWRGPDLLAATDFSLTRFLTPFLAGYEGQVVFCDCDFLFTSDIARLMALVDPDKAVSVVKNNHRPAETQKMGGQIQFDYPRKNWSSLMVFNCEHYACKRLTLEAVNERAPAWLHRFHWSADAAIGALPQTWNWLEGHSLKPKVRPPCAIHFTRGGPWHPGYEDVEYADLWRAERDMMQARAA